MPIHIRAVRLQSSDLPTILVTAAWLSDFDESRVEVWLIYPSPRGDGKQAFKRYIAVNRTLPDDDVCELANFAIAVDIEDERKLREPNRIISPTDDVAIDVHRMQMLRLLAPYDGFQEIARNSHCPELHRLLGANPQPTVSVVNEAARYPSGDAK